LFVSVGGSRSLNKRECSEKEREGGEIVADLIFAFAPMKAGKSYILLKTAEHFERKGKTVLLFTPSINTRDGKNIIASRAGLKREALPFRDEHNMTPLDYAMTVYPDLILVDEAQFLKRHEVEELAYIVDQLDINIICFGLKNDYKNELFEGSAALIALADTSVEIESECERCNRKATMNLLVLDGYPVAEGEQIRIGDEEYISVCRRCYKEAFFNAQKERQKQKEEGASEETKTNGSQG
jgi:thymidine kinase